jgi:tetratricopeptide (TPR) repeat protein
MYTDCRSRIQEGNPGVSLSAKQLFVSCMLLAVVTVAVYSPVVHHPFIEYDDPIYVTNNLHVQAGLTWKTFTWAWTTTEAENWHPLTWISHSLDCHLYGLNPAGHHLSSVLLHVLNGLLLFLLLARVTGATGRSLLVAASFALHPINVESVAWVAERKNLLSTLLFLLALGAYGWYARLPNVRRYLVVAVLFALGLAAKPMVITLPFVLLLLDLWPLQRIQGSNRQASPLRPQTRKNRRKRLEAVAIENTSCRFPTLQVTFPRLVLEKLPLLVLCAGSAVITVLAQQTTALRTMAKFPLATRVENAIYAYAMYVCEAFWPARLTIFYPHPGSSLAGWKVWLAALFLMAVSALVLKQRRGRGYLVTGWLWYLGTLVPVIGLVQVGDQAMADRYGYIPLIGIFVMAVWGVADVADAAAINFRWRAAFAVTILSALSFLTWRQTGYWRSDYDLWLHAVRVTKENVIAEEKLGLALAALGRAEEAVPGLEKAATLSPGDPMRHMHLGAVLIEVGRWQDAVVEYQRAIQMASNVSIYPKWKDVAIRSIQVRSYASLATIYDELDDYSKMRESYRQALHIDPQQGPDMIDRITSYAESEPSGKHYLQLAVLLQESGKLPEARDAYEQSLKLDPSLEEAKHSLDTLGPGNK